MQFPGGRTQQTRLFAAKMERFEPVPLAKRRGAKSNPPKNAPKTPTAAQAQPAGPDPADGLPGTEMLQITQELGIEDRPGCGCKGMAATMNRLGTEGCRMRVPELTLSIQATYKSWTGWDKLMFASKAAWKAVGLGVKPTDPIKHLVNLAIDRAEAKARVYRESQKAETLPKADESGTNPET